MICLALSGFYPKFVKKYVNLNRIIEKAVKKYSRDVKLKKISNQNNFLNGIKIVENKIEFKKILNFYNLNKLKIIFFLFSYYNFFSCFF